MSAIVLIFLSTVAASAQQTNVSQASEESDEEDLIVSARPGDANSAEFQKPGVLQIEYGYAGDFRSSEFRSEQAASLTVRFAPIERLLLEFNVDTVSSQKDRFGNRETGVGDSSVGLQVLALKDTDRHPALAFAFYTKLPTADPEKGLGTGRMDYRAVVLVSKQFDKTSIDFNAAYLNVGREFRDRRASGVAAAFAVSREFDNDFGIAGEISGQSEDDMSSKGIFALGAVTYKVNRRLQFDAGMRFGLNKDAPRVGVFAGFTVGIGKPFKN